MMLNSFILTRHRNKLRINWIYNTQEILAKWELRPSSCSSLWSSSWWCLPRRLSQWSGFNPIRRHQRPRSFPRFRPRHWGFDVALMSSSVL